MRKFRADLNFKIAFGCDGGRGEAAYEMNQLQLEIEQLIVKHKAHIEVVVNVLHDVGPMPLPPCPVCERRNLEDGSTPIKINDS